MSKWLKRIVLILVALVVLLAIVVAVAVATFDPNAYKSKLVSYVQDNYSRTLAVNGDIGLSIFPDFALELNDVSISEAHSQDNFASLQQARLSVAVLPLLRKSLQVDGVALNDFSARVIKNADGSFNFDDLLGKKSAAKAKSDGPGSSDTGAAETKSQSSRSDLQIDIAGIDIKNGQLNYIDKASKLNLNINNISAKTGAISFGSTFDASLSAQLKSADPVLDGAISLSSKVSLGNSFTDINARAIQLKFTGNAANLQKIDSLLTANVRVLDADITVNDLQLKAGADLAGDKPIKGIVLNLDDGQINIHSAAQTTTGNIKLAQAGYKDQIRSLSLTNIGADIKSSATQLVLSNLVADLYEGKLNGQFSSNKNHQLALKLDLQKVALQQLLQAVSGKDLIKGHGSTQLDINTQGQDLLAIEKNLNGTFAMQVVDGAILGVDARKTLEQTSAMLDDIKNIRLDKISSPFAPGYSTVFSKFDSLLTIKSGVATVSKLLLDTDVVSLTQGKPATINIPKQSLDLVLQAKITDKVDTSKNLKNLAGMVIPVYVSGNWDNPKYAVKIDDLLKNQGIENIIKSGINKLLGNDDKGSTKDSKSKEQPLGKALKGLFGG